ncbi:MAG TPA: AraC family transcriptional regulator [Rhodothermales bacterium]|nr:AraC family transcriptional regulator [Rhodothermales bacterium]
MRTQLYTDELSAPVFEGDTGEGDGGLTDVQFSLQHELARAEARRLSLDGIHIFEGSHAVTRDVVFTSRQDEPTVALNFNLGSGTTLDLPGGARLTTFPHTHTILYLPDPVLSFGLETGRRYHGFEVNLEPRYVDALLERYPELLDLAPFPVAWDQPFRTAPDVLPVTPRMLDAIDRIRRWKEYGTLGRMYVEAKVLELLALQLEHFLLARSGTRTPGLARRDVDRMYEARQVLLRRMADPPCLPELARLVGTNEFKLKRDFKAVFGKTVYDLLLEHRMEHARALLLDTDRLVADIAEEVGYAHGSHFSTAFKRVFGISPNQLRATGGKAIVKMSPGLKPCTKVQPVYPSRSR